MPKIVLVTGSDAFIAPGAGRYGALVRPGKNAICKELIGYSISQGRVNLNVIVLDPTEQLWDMIGIQRPHSSFIDYIVLGVNFPEIIIQSRSVKPISIGSNNADLIIYRAIRRVENPQAFYQIFTGIADYVNAFKTSINHVIAYTQDLLFIVASMGTALFQLLCKALKETINNTTAYARYVVR